MQRIVIFPCGPCGCQVKAIQDGPNPIVHTKCGGCDESYILDFNEWSINRKSDNKTYRLEPMLITTN